MHHTFICSGRMPISHTARSLVDDKAWLSNTLLGSFLQPHPNKACVLATQPSVCASECRRDAPKPHMQLPGC